MSRPSTLDLDALWGQSLEAVMGTVSSPAQRQWLAATQPVGFSDDTVVLASPHSFAREWLDTRCGDRIRQALSAAAGRPLHVVITVQPRPEPIDHLASSDGDRSPTGASEQARSADHLAGESFTAASYVDTDGRAADTFDAAPVTPDRGPSHTPLGNAAGNAAGEAARERDGSPPDRPLQAPGRPAGPIVSLPDRPVRTDDVEPETQLNPKYSFDDFVIGSSNRFAHAAANAVAEAPAKSYNPLFIYGGAGLGKTHLLHAIGHYVRNLYPRLKVRYITTEQFTNEFINAIRDDRITTFQRTYRQADVLLIDDIQFLEQKERTQEEFFHTFNALHNAEKQIVISSDRPPKQIPHLEDRLRSRFEWGLMTDVQPPDLETRIAILRKKAESDRLGVAPEVLELIASKVESNIRELEGALIRVSAFASLQRSSADSAMAEMVLKDLFPDDREQEVSVQLIMDEVADYFSLTVEDLCSPSRSRQLVTARQIAMYLARELTDLSLPRIGKAFGGRDHTTVMHAKSKIAGLMQERRTIYDQVQELTNRIKTRARRP
ncbi:chromosomal replication initiator protein DnaA [Egicoccus sp. AB-alg2]|uniref:chromosomal replication initiator protein DnaA n=1 Tax=Egicoccus sp. AB-alg2 TaxID=3242693 RepID=UPI00359DC31B